MGTKTQAIVALGEMTDGQEGDLFALLAAKEQLSTRDGKPYFRVTFRDAQREVSFPIWSDATWYDECRAQWAPGAFYKLRALYRETNYGPQLEIRRIRETTDADASDGFDPLMMMPRSRFAPEQMFDELATLAEREIADPAVAALVIGILAAHHDELLSLPAAKRNHHGFVGGWLEHVLAVTRHCVYLADRYREQYPDLAPPLDRDLVIAGGVLHDIGKLRELELLPGGPDYTPAGSLIGHVLQGRDIVREAAQGRDIDPEKLLRLEHIIVSHQRLPEWGSPKPPMTPEALLVHYADDVDAKFHMMYAALRDDANQGPLTSKQNPLMQPIFRGGAGA